MKKILQNFKKNGFGPNGPKLNLPDDVPAKKADNTYGDDDDEEIVDLDAEHESELLEDINLE